ncbi:MAG TPA: methyltransferase domain-containing protein [Micromonospora sp.]|nr:methyltransferase domain-containing protein [Micromonospora sp.]
MPSHPRLDVRESDLNRDDPALLGQEWDFIHARLTLGHLPARREILARLVAALKPGGRLLIEDWDASRTGMVLAAPSPEAVEQYTLVQETVGRLFATAGTDRTWARRLHAALLAEGLTDVHTVLHAESWTGGEPGCHLAAVTIDELRPALLAAGLADTQLDQAQQLLAHPTVRPRRPPALFGQRPTTRTAVNRNLPTRRPGSGLQPNRAGTKAGGEGVGHTPMPPPDPFAPQPVKDTVSMTEETLPARPAHPTAPSTCSAVQA